MRESSIVQGEEPGPQRGMSMSLNHDDEHVVVLDDDLPYHEEMPLPN